MATVQQLMSALRKADAAGNTADAKRLAQLIRQATTPVDRSFASAFKSGIDAPLENMAQTARVLGKNEIADNLSGLTEAPVNYESASNRFINPQEGDKTIGGFAYEYLPRAAVEQAGQFAGSLASRTGGGLLAGGLTGGNPIAIGVGAAVAPAMFEFVQQVGGNALERAKNNGREEPNMDDWKAASATAGLSGVLNAFGVKGGAGVFNSILREGLTEGAQSGVQQTGVSLGTEAGLQLDPKQAIGEGIIGGTSAGGVQTGIATAKAPVTVTRAAVKLVSGDGNIPSDTEAAADFARDLQATADEKGYDLEEVNPTATGGAKTTIDDVHSRYSEDMNSLARLLREKLGYKDTDPEADRINKVIAKTAIKMGKNKAKNFVGKKDIEAVRKIVGKTQEGERLISLLRKSNELTRVSNAGLKGGVSKFTDIFNPLDTANQGYSAPRNLVGALATGLGGAAAYGTGGASLLPQAAAVGAGRAIDKVTGRRSKVAKYIRDNAQNKGIEKQDLPSLAKQNEVAQQGKALQKFLKAQQKRIEAERKRVADEKEQQRIRALNIDKLRRGDPPKGDKNDPNPSPQYIMQTATGLDRRGVANMLNIISNRDSYKNLHEAAQSYRDMLVKATPVKDQNELISAVKGLVLKMGGTLPDAVPQNVQQSLADTKRQTGIDGNKQRIAQLRQDLNDDPDVTAIDKRIINRALDVLELPLGSDPVKAAEDILTEAEGRVANKSKATQYLKPYVERVRQQQKKPLSNQN